MYHNGKSENAIKRCLISRYPREKFRLASKLPTFAITKEEQVEEIFAQQMEKMRYGIFDYFLLHNVNGIRYEREIKECHMFEHMQQWKKDGKIRHIGFSYHDSADNLDKILSEHPEVEFVQIALNYIDWEAYLIQAKKCYEVIRKHGCQVIVMEPVERWYAGKGSKESRSTHETGGSPDVPGFLGNPFCSRTGRDLNSLIWNVRFSPGGR